MTEMISAAVRRRISLSAAILVAVITAATASVAVATNEGVPAGEISNAQAADLVGSVYSPAVDPASATDSSSPDVAISQDFSDGYSVESDTGTVELTPVTDDESSVRGSAIGNDAIVYSDTAPQTDTVVRASDDGVETFTSIRGPGAPEAFSFRVNLAGDQHLSLNADGTVGIIDPNPPASLAPSDASKPPVVEGGTARSDELADEYGVPPWDGSLPSGAAAEANDAPSDIKARVFTPEAMKAAIDKSSNTASGPALLDDQAIQDAASASIDEVRQDSQEELEMRQDLASEGTDQAYEENSETHDAVVVAEISAPWAKDADGDAVPLALSVDGDVVTMTVDHRGGDVAYPVVADPDTYVTAIKPVWAYTPVYSSAAYVSGWSLGASQIGPAPWYACWQAPCQDLGNGLYMWGTADETGRPVVFAPSGTAADGTFWIFYSQPAYNQGSNIDRWEPFVQWQTYQQPVGTPVPMLTDPVMADADRDEDPEFTPSGDIPDDPDSTPAVLEGAVDRSKDEGCRTKHSDFAVRTGYSQDVAVTIGHSLFDPTFCWKKSTHRAWSHGGDQPFGVDLGKAWEAAGYETEIDPNTYLNVRPWRGHDFGSTQMQRRFVVKSCVPIVKVGCVTIGAPHHSVIARYNGTTNERFTSDGT